MFKSLYLRPLSFLLSFLKVKKSSNRNFIPPFRVFPFFLGPIYVKYGKQTADDISLPRRPVINREPISFRLKSSASCDDLFASSIQRDIRYNTMIKKRNVFSTKSGRPVAFLSASPRFEETSEKPIKLYKKPKKKSLVDESTAEGATTKVEGTPSQEGDEDEKTSTDSSKKPKTRLSLKRLGELAMPKIAPMKKITSDKVQVFNKTSASNFKHLAQSARSFKKFAGFADIDVRRLREVIRKEQEEVVEIQERHIFVAE